MHCGSTRHCVYACINVYSLEAVIGRGQAGRNSFDVLKDLELWCTLILTETVCLL